MQEKIENSNFCKLLLYHRPLVFLITSLLCTDLSTSIYIFISFLSSWKTCLFFFVILCGTFPFEQEMKSTRLLDVVQSQHVRKISYCNVIFLSYREFCFVNSVYSFDLLQKAIHKVQVEQISGSYYHIMLKHKLTMIQLYQNISQSQKNRKDNLYLYMQRQIREISGCFWLFFFLEGGGGVR